MYKKRHLQSKLLLMAQHFKVVLITGARQVGKTRLLEETFAGMPMITFDPTEDVQNARKDPNFFLKSNTKPLILDEVQYAPELLAALKRFVDKDNAPGQYFMTGSHNLNLLTLVAESMAGRVGILNLLPMTTYEQVDYVHFNEKYEQDPPLWLSIYLQDPALLPSFFAGVTSQSLVHVLWRGGMPGTLALPESLVPDFFSSYLQAYIERDARYFNTILDLAGFRQFIHILGASTGQEINPTDLGKKIEIERSTTRKWLEIAKATYQWYELPAYDNNMTKRVIGSKYKGYFTDTGLACYLQRMSDPYALMNFSSRGALFETLVVNSVRAMLASLQQHPGMYYWRTRNNAEVDLILESNGALYPIEIKMKGSLSGYDARGLKAFREAYNGELEVKTALIIYAGTDCYWFNETTIALPWNAVMKIKF